MRLAESNEAHCIWLDVCWIRNFLVHCVEFSPWGERGREERNSKEYMKPVLAILVKPTNYVDPYGTLKHRH